MEEGILKFWKENKIFEKSVENRKDDKPFVFFEGPPTANAKPGVHHVEARVFKDLFPRYKTMQGYFCDRKGGWDCHGLPVELQVEKKLGISGKQQIEEYGVEKFNKLCRDSVFEFIGDWQKMTERIGYWVDMKDSYETMNNGFIESGWGILKQLWEKGLFYEDYKVVPYCPRCGTPLSSHELAQGYKDDVRHMSVYVKFKLKEKENTFFVAWTTTPWTLPGNVALAVDEKADYVTVSYQNQKLILAKERLAIFGEEVEILENFKGKDLINLEYEPLFQFVKYDKKAHYVVPADFVTMEEGTGIVHTAVMYGVDDFNLGQKFDLPKKHLVDEKGQFIPEVTLWAGMFVKKADPHVIEKLEEDGALLKKEEIRHTYPFCWRCDTPLLYYAITSWYLKTTEVKDELIKNNESVNWVPAHIRDGRMGEWLKNNHDWAFSRTRYWGTPMPVWRCDSCNTDLVVGSVGELSKLSSKDLSSLDLHRPFVDEITFDCSCGKGKMKRLPFVVDVWFDSGSMPFAQWHYPFENKEKFESHFPADYICEAIDQTRGWFYTLQAVSTLLGKESPYKNVICLGHVLDEKGNKMSKSKGNIVDPMEIVNGAGADAMRWYFYSIISPGESFRFSLNLVKDVNRRFLLTLWNVYVFFVTYANLDGWEPKNKIESKDILDKWITARLNELVNAVTLDLDNLDSYKATKDIENFVNDLSTWYIRRSRDRKNDDFYETIYMALVSLSKIIAPFTPFIAEEMYKNLTGLESVHLEDYPKADKFDEELIKQMVVVRKVCEMGHAKRKENNLKVRQPLQKVTINVELSDELKKLIQDELNVKEVKIGESESELELDINLTPELIDEGKARDLVRDIQDARKALGTTLDENVKVVLPSWPEKFEEYIKTQTLAISLEKGEELRVERL